MAYNCGGVDGVAGKILTFNLPDAYILNSAEFSPHAQVP